MIHPIVCEITALSPCWLESEPNVCEWIPVEGLMAAFGAFPFKIASHTYQGLTAGHIESGIRVLPMSVSATVSVTGSH